MGRRGRQLLRCNDCQAPVVWLMSPHGGGYNRRFDAKPVDGRTHTGAAAYPVEGRRAWKLADLVEDLQARRETTREAAETEAYDMPWHTPHDCPNSPFHTTPDTETP